MKIKVIVNYDGIEVVDMEASKAAFRNNKRIWKAWLETSGLCCETGFSELKYWYVKRQKGVLTVSYGNRSYSFVPTEAS